MRIVRVVPLVAFLVAALPAALEALPQAEPWGYLYVLRTHQLQPLTLEETTIGRLPENHVILSSPRVSRRHAAIRTGGDSGVELVDVGSSNGTTRNGQPLRPRAPVPLAPGDWIDVAEERILFHTALPDLWRDELAHRLLARVVKLRRHLPQDQTRRAYGREEIVDAVTEARVTLEAGEVDVKHSVELAPDSGLPEQAGAFVGSVVARDGVLELSLWTIASGSSMTSRRASFSNLKHATLRVSIAEKKSDGTEEGGARGPWFPEEVLAGLFEVFPDDEEIALQFATSLASQERPKALSDAASSLRFRHRLNPGEGKLLLIAAEAQGLFVEREVDRMGLSLGAEDRTRLEAALAEGRGWVDEARELGAREEAKLKAEDALTRAGERLSRIVAVP